MSVERLELLVINWQDIRNPLAGGAEVHLHEIFTRLVQRGHRVTLLASRFDGAAEQEVVDGLAVVRRGQRSTFNFVVPRTYRELRQSRRFDVVVDDINKIPFYTPLYVAEPLVALVHHFFGKSIYREVPWPLASYVYAAERLVPAVYRRQWTGAVSPSTRNELLAHGFDPAKVLLVPNGVDTRQYVPDPGQRESAPLVGYLGRLKRYKSVDHLLLAFKQLLEWVPQARLLVVGDGDDRPRLQRLAQQLGLDAQVEFTGAVSEADKVRHLQRMWVCVNPSPKEGWGLTVIEANACGTPVVAANSPGLRDSVVDGQTGYLYPYGDVDRLANLLKYLLSHEEERKRLGENALAWARQFGWDRAADRMEELLGLALQSG
ncbi:MAG: glycosyltransferase family 4 protein [Calditrichaeota bacterium]|nr:glycosyltransferase family 4 protein [Calditrichota bacterium]